MYIKKVLGTWFLMDKEEIVESYGTREEAELALFDTRRTWTSLYDLEKRRVD